MSSVSFSASPTVSDTGWDSLQRPSDELLDPWAESSPAPSAEPPSRAGPMRREDFFLSTGSAAPGSASSGSSGAAPEAPAAHPAPRAGSMKLEEFLLPDEIAQLRSRSQASPDPIPPGHRVRVPTLDEF